MNIAKRNGQRVSQARKVLRKQNAKYPKVPAEIPKSEWPNLFSGGGDNTRTRVWRSCDFLIQEFTLPGDLIRLSICRTDLNPQGKWKDNISWDELQMIKKLIGYADQDAVEIFPEEEHMVNVANMRHLWVLPDPIPWKWQIRKEAPS